MNKLYTNAAGTKFVEFAASSKSLTSEIATRDIEGFWSSVFNMLQNPDPVLRKSGNAIDVLDEVKREPQVSSCSTSREAGVMSRHWEIDPEKASASSVELIENLLKDLPMRQIQREILEAWGYGYQVSEVVWKRQGNYLLPHKIIGKPHEWFFFGNENELRMKTKGYDFRGEQVPAHKFLLTQYRASYKNPYGEAQYSMCFWPVTFKKGGLKFWSIFLEKFGMPHATGKLPRSANDTERTNLLNALSQLVRDACAVFPDDASVELLQMSNVSGSSDAYERFAKYHDAQISTIILGHSAGASSTPGRLGGEDTAMEIRHDIVDSDADMVCNTLNTLIQWIYELNPTLGKERCKFGIYADDDVDTERAERDKTLSETGQVKFKKTYFLKKYDFDDEDIDVVDSTPVSNNAPPQFSAPSGKTDPQDAIDQLLDVFPDEMKQKQIELVLKPVLDLVEMSSSYEEVNKGLAKLFPDLNTSEIQTVLEKAVFLGEVWGRVNGGEN